MDIFTEGGEEQSLDGGFVRIIKDPSSMRFYAVAQSSQSVFIPGTI